jgi:hypothetical protein
MRNRTACSLPGWNCMTHSQAIRSFSDICQVLLHRNSKTNSPMLSQFLQEPGTDIWFQLYQLAHCRRNRDWTGNFRSPSPPTHTHKEISICCSSAFWHHVDSYVETNFSKKINVSFFRAEGTLSTVACLDELYRAVPWCPVAFIITEYVRIVAKEREN